MSTQTQLDEINTAITSILSGAQEYRIGNRSMKRADLSFLFKERNRLELKLESETSSDILNNTSVAVFDGR